MLHHKDNKKNDVNFLYSYIYVAITVIWDVFKVKKFLRVPLTHKNQTHENF